MVENRQYDINEIKELLLHRYPFLLIDRVLSLEDNKSIVALKNISANEDFFNGHFPSMPVMPGVLMIEAMAQAAAFLAYKSTDAIAPGMAVLLAGVNNVRWKRMVVPGDQLELKVEYAKNRKPFWYFNAVATVDGKVACKAEIMAAESAVV